MDMEMWSAHFLNSHYNSKMWSFECIWLLKMEGESMIILYFSYCDLMAVTLPSRTESDATEILVMDSFRICEEVSQNRNMIVASMTFYIGRLTLPTTATNLAEYHCICYHKSLYIPYNYILAIWFTIPNIYFVRGITVGTCECISWV